jgi:tetratricopeptide (TPR) repeat protein
VRLAPGAAATLGLALITASTARGEPMHYSPSPIEQAYRAGKAAADEDVARGNYQRGIDLARQTLARAPDQPDALLWLAANLAGEALTHSKLHALKVIPEIERTLLRLEQVAPLHDHAAAARALANLYWKAPAVISVGSSKKAAAYFDLALRRAPDFPGNQALAAAFYASERDCGRATPLATAVMAHRDLDSFGPDAAEWRQLARDVLRDCR